ncbi:MAG: uracil-DNA glycosylase [Gemmatimonadetes bacterium]|nr:uracil-DNA glycosylase [Gemmatimonadota bacterium]NIQ59516.1 uracil-DNA glycosylase [Gemmatimonadota bacterium]NIU79709.1 uracil-DNA glycosylase [Gammaproteobacteria bacterium]NIX48246.1 uracil-DNA glycosylase [Gemmatimonadota bacterium]NIY12683.1 uracil-DNA glycosylase [Gemmatimonadota bacterium]
MDRLFLDRLTADEATSLLSRMPVRPRPDAGPGTGSGTAAPPAGGPAGGARDPAEGPAQGAGLEVLARQASGCTRCRLSEGRTQVVFGRGSATAELVVVGEAPGREEDRTGLPFVGPAGKLLDLLLLSVGFDRESVYICNVLKCRPPNNRDPLADEVKTCAPYLHGQLDAIRPTVLLAVGKFAAQMLSGSDAAIGRLRGRVHEYRGVPVVATYHPAYLLRSPHATRKTWQDLQLMRQVMDEHA